MLVRRIFLLLPAQLLARHKVRILAQLAHRALPLALVLGAQTVGLGAFAVGVVVFVRVEGFLELGDGGFDGEGAVVVEEEGTAGSMGRGEVGGELVEGGLDGVLEGGCGGRRGGGEGFGGRFRGGKKGFAEVVEDGLRWVEDFPVCRLTGPEV